MPSVFPGLPSGEILPLWPDGAIPGGAGVAPAPDIELGEWGRYLRGVARPTLEIHRPAQPDGSAALLLPGGGYGIVSYDNEGLAMARWLTARGTTAFVLVYRLPGEGWADRARVPLQDAQRAMRLIRAGAPGFGIDPGRVAVLGFSAGGHMAGLLATRATEPSYAPIDDADDLPARPDLVALIYAVATLHRPLAHRGTAENLCGPGATSADLAAASIEELIGPHTPPLFLLHAADDEAVAPANSLLLHDAALRAGVPAELHLFAAGGHGFATRLAPDHPAMLWPQLWARWAAAQGLFTA